MLIETWVAAVIMLFIFVIALISICGWTVAAEKNEKLMRDNEKLQNKIKDMRKLLTIKEADDFYKERGN